MRSETSPETKKSQRPSRESNLEPSRLSKRGWCSTTEQVCLRLSKINTEDNHDLTSTSIRRTSMTSSPTANTASLWLDYTENNWIGFTFLWTVLPGFLSSGAWFWQNRSHRFQSLSRCHGLGWFPHAFAVWWSPCMGLDTTHYTAHIVSFGRVCVLPCFIRGLIVLVLQVLIYLLVWASRLLSPARQN